MPAAKRVLLLGLLTLGLLYGPAPTANAGFFDKAKKLLNEQIERGGADKNAPSLSDIDAGLRAALRVGSQRVVERLGAGGGYLEDPKIRIPLPRTLRKAQSIMRQFGLSGIADDLETRLNRAAEEAAPKTLDLFWQAIKAMTLADARQILNGPKDAATQYFKRVATDDLYKVISPVVDQALDKVGAVAAYDQMIQQYRQLPLVPDVKADLSRHTTRAAMKGLFHYLAREEAAIRDDPAKRTTALLVKVFAGR